MAISSLFNFSDIINFIMLKNFDFEFDSFYNILKEGVCQKNHQMWDQNIMHLKYAITLIPNILTF